MVHILSALFLLVCNAHLLVTTSDNYKSKAQDLVSSLTKIENPDLRVVNAVNNVAAIALNQPLDKEAFDLWMNRLGSSLNDSETPSKYRDLGSKADELKKLDPGNGSVGSPSQTAIGSDISKTNSGTVPTVESGNTANTGVTATESAISASGSAISASGSATSTSTGTDNTQTASTRANGLPFQPRPADSSTMHHFSILGTLILLFF